MSVAKLNFADTENQFEWDDAVEVDEQTIQKWIEECVASVREQIAAGNKGYLWSSTASGNRVVIAEYWTDRSSTIEARVLQPVKDYWFSPKAE